MKKIKQWICRVFGHRFDAIDAMVFDLSAKAVWKNFTPKIRCRRCGKTFEAK